MIGRKTGFDFSFESCAAIVLKVEAGLTMDPKDKGNWTGGKIGVGVLKGTNRGISAASYPNEDIKNMTRERALYLFKRDYWNKLRLQEKQLNLMALDCAVNQGLGISNGFLDQVKGLPSIRDKVEKFYDLREARYGKTTGWESFLKGWINRLDDVYDRTIINLA